MCGILCLALSSIAAAADKSPVNITGVETKDLHLYYYDYLGFLEPHAVRTFTNSLAWQRRIFGWMPSEATTVLLQDFADYGNAHAYVAPHDTLEFDVAPLSHTFETFPGERAHVLADEPRAHPRGARRHRESRRIGAGVDSFSARSPPQSQQPGIAALQLPHHPALSRRRAGTRKATRCSSRPGWAAGWAARRAATTKWYSARWCATTRTSTIRWGLSREAYEIDFQGGANAYLYGTRFFTWLAYTYSPETLIAWTRRDEGSTRYYADQFQQVFGIPLRAGLAALDHVRARVPAAQPRRGAQVSDHARAQADRERVGVGIAHVLRRGDGRPVRRLPVSRHRRARRAP